MRSSLQPGLNELVTLNLYTPGKEKKLVWMSFFKFGYLLNFKGDPKLCEASSGTSPFNESISEVFWSKTLGSKIMHDTLLSLSSLSSSAAVVALETMSLAPIPDTPTLVMYASDCWLGRVLNKKVSALVNLKVWSPLINP